MLPLCMRPLFKSAAARRKSEALALLRMFTRGTIRCYIKCKVAWYSYLLVGLVFLPVRARYLVPATRYTSTSILALGMQGLPLVLFYTFYEYMRWNKGCQPPKIHPQCCRVARVQQYYYSSSLPVHIIRTAVPLLDVVDGCCCRHCCASFIHIYQ